MQISIPVLITAQTAGRGKGIVLFIASPVLEQVVCVGAVSYIWHGRHQSSGFPNRNKKNNKQQNPFSQEFRNYDPLCFCIVHFFLLVVFAAFSGTAQNCVRTKMVFYILTSLYQYIMDHIRFRGVKRRGSWVFVCEKPNQITVRYGYLLLHA